MIVLLDFDGVCHPRVGGGGFTSNCIAALAEALRPFPVQIVVSSTWRLTCHQEELETLLQDLGKPVIGTTPELPRGTEHKRYEEILAYIKENDTDIEWVAIDDASHLFPANAPVFQTNPSKGFVKDDIEGLQRLIGLAPCCK